MAKKIYDVIIVGAGTSGLTARREVAKTTSNYLVVDPGPLGTTCARVGCMPSKSFVEVALKYGEIHKLGPFLKSQDSHLSLDSKKVMEHVRNLRDQFTGGVLSSMDSWGDHFLKDRVRLLGPTSLETSSGEVLEFKACVLATGSSPIRWPGAPNGAVTTDEFFELADLEGSWSVIGGGAVGVELGQALALMGLDVTLFSATKDLAGLTDPEVLRTFRTRLEKEIEVSYERVEEVKAQGREILVKTPKASRTSKRVLLALGRRPNLESLDLERACDEWDPKSPLGLLNPKTLQLGSSHLFLAGDVTNQRPVLHEASDQGYRAGRNGSLWARGVKDLNCLEPRTPLNITFTSPGLAVVGKTYGELTKENRAFKVGQVDFSTQGRAKTMLNASGVLRIYGDPASGEILGSELMTPRAENLAHLLALMVHKKMTAMEALKMPFYHPVLEEGLRTALRELVKKVDPEPSREEILRCQDDPVTQGTTTLT